MNIEERLTPNGSDGNTRRTAPPGSRVVPATVAADLQQQILDAGGSESELHELFDELNDRVGRDEASRLWWAAFGATDAAET